jgi:hypothetical protein
VDEHNQRGGFFRSGPPKVKHVALERSVLHVLEIRLGLADQGKLLDQERSDAKSKKHCAAEQYGRVHQGVPFPR